MSGFRISGSTTLAKTAFLTLARTTVVAPDGTELERHVVHHPGAVVVVPVVPERDVAICIRQYRVATGAELLEVPAGKRDVDGEPPEDTARRELVEEIGRRAGRLELLAEFWNSPGFCTEYTHLYLATELGEAGPTAHTSAEEAAMTFEEVSLGAVDDLVGRRELVDAKSIIGLVLARDALARARGDA